MTDQSRVRRLRNRSLLFTVVLIIAVASSELASFVALRYVDAARPSADPVAEIVQHARDPVGRVLPHEILHPYLGWVMDADIPGGARVLERSHPVNQYGFLDRGIPRERAKENEFRIAVVGGSVAWYFALDAVDLFVGTLQQSPQFRDREIVVLPLALSGYKQPQQLFTIVYFLSLGVEIDAVVNIDGFNDVALHPFENAPRQISIAFPRSWDARIAEVPDRRKAEIVYRLTARYQERKAWAERFDGVAADRSQTLRLVWRVGDSRLEDMIASDQIALAAEAARTDSPFRVTGPHTDYESRDAMFGALADLWARSSLQLDRLCRANGIAYYHFLQPNQYLVGSKQMTEAERELAIVDDHPYREGVEHGYPLLIEEGHDLSARGVHFHDLTGLFSKTQEQTYRDSCCHYNSRGNELLAVRIAEAIIELPPSRR
jgi:hypothetical protein